MLFQSNSGRYTLQYKLSGHQDAIISIAVASSGNLLASGGMDGLRIWDLQRQVQIAKPNQTRNPRDPVTCLLVWLTRKDDVQETLCAGTGLGYIILWRQRADRITEFDEVWSRRVGTGQEIMTITCETFEGNPRIITATRDRRVQLWSLDSKYHLSNLFSIELASTVPRASCFYRGDVMIFGMYDGDICTLRSKDGVVLGTQTTGRMIGGAAVDQTRTCVVIDNGVAGYSLHRIDDGTCTRSYDTKPQKTFPKQVAFAERGEKIVGGGEAGKVFVFHKTTGVLEQVLRHSNTGRVQTISTYEGDTFRLIATASSGNENEHKINIWKKRTVKEPSKSSWSRCVMVVKTMSHLFAIGMLLLIAAHTMAVGDLWKHYQPFRYVGHDKLEQWNEGKESNIVERWAADIPPLAPSEKRYGRKRTEPGPLEDLAEQFMVQAWKTNSQVFETDEDEKATYTLADRAEQFMVVALQANSRVYDTEE